MIQGVTVQKIQSGDVISICIKGLNHWAVVVAPEYPTKELCLIAPTSTTYKSSRKKLRFTPEQFPPSLNENSHVTLQFQVCKMSHAKLNYCGRLEDRGFVKEIVNAHFSELNNIRNALNQLKNTSK